MFLSHKTIERLIADGQITIGPEFDLKDIRPVGVRIHIANEILVPEERQTVDLNEAVELKYKTVHLDKEEFYLEPGGFILGATYELIKTPKDVVCFLDGRSTIARLGLTTHITAAIIEGVYDSPHSTVLEIKNLGNFRIRLHYKNPIGMMCFAKITEPIEQELQSQYKSQEKVAPPNLKFRTGIDK